jgi:hypothetical protein
MQDIFLNEWGYIVESDYLIWNAIDVSMLYDMISIERVDKRIRSADDT